MENVEPPPDAASPPPPLPPKPVVAAFDVEAAPVAGEAASDSAPLLDGGGDAPHRGAAGDIFAGLAALTVGPLLAAGGALHAALPSALQQHTRAGADALQHGAGVLGAGLKSGAVAARDGFVQAGTFVVAAMPQEVKDGLAVAQRGAVAAKDAALVGTGIAVSVLPREFRDVAHASRDAVEKLAEAGRAVERLLKDKAWRGRDADGKQPQRKPFFNYYRTHLAYVLGSCTFFGAIMLINDPNPPDNLVDSIFMTISAMSGAGLTTIPMSEMSRFGMGCIFILMLMGGICFLLLPPVLFRLYQYRRYKPLVQEVLVLRRVIRAREGDAGVEGVPQENDLVGDFELQDEGLKLLAWVIGIYNACFLILGTLFLYAAIMAYGPVPAVVERGINHFWFATFAAVSSFNNVGFSLLDDNYVSLFDRPAALLLMCIMIVAGNTGLPIALRAIFGALSYLRPKNRAIAFVLNNPRRCTTAFFNTKQSVALTFILIFNLLLQYVFFLSTSMNLPNIRALGSRDQLAVGGFFTSVSTRAAGMNVFDLRELSKANVLVFAIMMYIASAPFVSMMESTKQEVVAKYVNGELLLVYEGGEGDEEAKTGLMKKYLNSHLRWLVIFYLVIATAEQSVLMNIPPVSLFDIMFEILSAYGTSGLSMGSPGKPFSLCGEFNDVSKIVLCIVKLMGKHRGLPSNTDAALNGQFNKVHAVLEGLQVQAAKLKQAAVDAAAAEARKTRCEGGGEAAEPHSTHSTHEAQGTNGSTVARKVRDGSAYERLEGDE